VRLCAWLSVMTMVACGGSAAGAPRGDPYITGVVQQVSPWVPVTENCVPPDPDADPETSVSDADPPTCQSQSDVAGTVLVDGELNATVATTTLLLRETGDDYRPARFTDLTQGRTISVWMDSVQESFPAGGTAVAIVIHR
jgi:hypothetical protein